MPSCVMRLTGRYTDIAKVMEDAFLPFKESGGTSRGRRLGRTTEQDDATFNYPISKADGDHVPIQITEAQAFLTEHLDQLTDLMANPAINHGMIDFGWTIPIHKFGQFNRFPSSLLAICAQLRLDIEVSVYLDHPQADSDEEE